MLPSRIGTAIHEGIERAWTNNYRNALATLGINKRVIDLVRINPTAEEVKQNPDIIPVYMEQRLTKQVGKWTVSGKFDFVGQGRLEDFKKTTSFVVQRRVSDDKFTYQGSIYRWMGSDIITQDNMAIQFIITDWKKNLAATDPSYPQAPLVERILPLKPVEEVRVFVEHKLAQIEKYWDAPEDQIPQCEEDDLQRTEPLFKYYGDPAKAELGGRSTKNFDDKQAAYLHLSQAGKGVIKEVPGQVKACHFCKAFPVCTQKDDLMRAGHLIL
jgi:hypothetical protein